MCHLTNFAGRGLNMPYDNFYSCGRGDPVFEVSDRVRKAREFSGATQGELAASLGVSRTTLARIEQGLSNPRRPALIAIAMATGVDLDWLETGKPPPGIIPTGVVGAPSGTRTPEPAVLRPRVLLAA